MKNVQVKSMEEPGSQDLRRPYPLLSATGKGFSLVGGLIVAIAIVLFPLAFFVESGDLSSDYILSFALFERFIFFIWGFLLYSTGKVMEAIVGYLTQALNRNRFFGFLFCWAMGAVLTIFITLVFFNHPWATRLIGTKV